MGAVGLALGNAGGREDRGLAPIEPATTQSRCKCPLPRSLLAAVPFRCEPEGTRGACGSLPEAPAQAQTEDGCQAPGPLEGLPSPSCDCPGARPEDSFTDRPGDSAMGDSGEGTASQGFELQSCHPNAPGATKRQVGAPEATGTQLRDEAHTLTLFHPAGKYNPPQTATTPTPLPPSVRAGPTGRHAWSCRHHAVARPQPESPAVPPTDSRCPAALSGFPVSSASKGGRCVYERTGAHPHGAGRCPLPSTRSQGHAPRPLWVGGH